MPGKPLKLIAGRDGETVVVGLGELFVGIPADEAVRFARAVLDLAGQIELKRYDVVCWTDPPPGGKSR